jgi:tetratricopeptide (TPR) repeat protein
MVNLYEVRLRHARYFEGVLAAAQELHARGAEWQKGGFEQFETEQLNILPALAWAAGLAERDDAAADLCIRFLAHGGSFLMLRHHPSERVRSLEAGLAAARRLRQAAFESLFLYQLSNAYFISGDYRKAVELGSAANAIEFDLSETTERALFLSGFDSPYAETAQVIGEVDRKSVFHELADLLHRRITGSVPASTSVGTAAEAIELAEAALHGFRESGDRTGEAAALANLGAACAEAGDSGRAIETLVQARNLCRELKDKRGEANAISKLVPLYAASNDNPGSLDLATEVLTIYQELKDANGEMLSLMVLGVLQTLAGEYGSACEFHKRALVIARKLNDTNYEAVILSQINLCLEQSGGCEAMLTGAEEAALSLEDNGLQKDVDLSESLKETEHRHGHQ